MEIKLRAKLSAYARVETLQPNNSASPEDSCDLVTAGPVRNERIDLLFSDKNTDNTASSTGSAFIDSLFK